MYSNKFSCVNPSLIKEEYDHCSETIFPLFTNICEIYVTTSTTWKHFYQRILLPPAVSSVNLLRELDTANKEYILILQ